MAIPIIAPINTKDSVDTDVKVMSLFITDSLL